MKAKPRRHSKPHDSSDGDGRARKVIVSVGRAAGLEPSDIIHAITAATGLDGEHVRNVRVLERFTLLEVPEQDVDRVVDRVSGTELLRPARAARAGRDVASCQVSVNSRKGGRDFGSRRCVAVNRPAVRPGT